MKPVLLLAALLGGCGAPTPGPGHARAVSNELDPSGRPYAGPSVVATNPPADNGAQRLSCHPEGQGTRCDRSP